MENRKARSARARMRGMPAAAWRRLHTQHEDTDPARLELATAAVKARVLATALLVFMLGLSVDDLRILRFPGWLAGAAGALALVAFGPLWQGYHVARSSHRSDRADFQHRLGSLRRQGTLMLLLVAVLFLFWLVLFSEGVPPWAA